MVGVQPLYPLTGSVPIHAVRSGVGPQRVVGLEYRGQTWGQVLGALREDAPLGLASAWIALDSVQRCGAHVPSAAPGVAVRTSDDLRALLDASQPAAVWIDAGASARALWAMSPSEGRLGILANPWGAWVQSGVLFEPWSAHWEALRQRLQSEDASSCALADGTLFHDAGASGAQALGFALAALLETVREVGTSVWPRVVVRLAVDAELFASIAQVRAARWLLAAIGHKLGCETGPGEGPRLSVRTGWRNRARQDSWNNLVRATLEGFAALVGSADELVVQPHTAAEGRGESDARRWGLGLQHVLMAEAGITRVEDPGRGAPYVEAWTRGVAREAWAVVQEIEQCGGMAAALQAGIVQAKVRAAAQRGRTAMADGTMVLTGVNLYPDPDPLGELGRLGVAPGGSRPPGMAEIERLAPLRWAEPWESVNPAGEGQ